MRSEIDIEMEMKMRVEFDTEQKQEQSFALYTLRTRDKRSRLLSTIAELSNQPSITRYSLLVMISRRKLQVHGIPDALSFSALSSKDREELPPMPFE